MSSHATSETASRLSLSRRAHISSFSFVLHFFLSFFLSSFVVVVLHCCCPSHCRLRPCYCHHQHPSSYISCAAAAAAAAAAYFPCVDAVWPSSQAASTQTGRSSHASKQEEERRLLMLLLLLQPCWNENLLVPTAWGLRNEEDWARKCHTIVHRALPD
jgi:hypothetical protein